jgi:sporulation protein YlmC with PRC-barrel domain
MASPDDTTNPSGKLIAAHKVQGTSVYNTALEKLGRVEDLMIDKAAALGEIGLQQRTGRLRRRYRPRDA